MKILNLITPADTLHGSLGIGAVLNGIWLDWLDPSIQGALTIGGALYLYYMIRAKRMEWKLKTQEFNEKEALQNE
jgi:threonine/homoserine/homoserine lactone efflux protein